ncbi:MAG: hypothetical protein JWN56_2671 [Sphingobacteriales bacterium]|nr:hypothetical protein [Sphingobacteriales bacterium]
MKTSLVSVLKYIFLLLLAISLLVLAFRGQNLEQLSADLKSADYNWVIISSLACLVAHLFRAYRWQMLIKTLEYTPPSIVTTFHAVMIGYMANLALPRMGEITRCGVINKTNNIPVNKLIGTVIIERLTDVFMLMAVTSLAVFFQFELIYRFLNQHIFSFIASKTSNNGFLLIITVLVLIVLVPFVIILNKKADFKVPGKIINLWQGLSNGLKSFYSLENKWEYIIYSLLIWFFYYLSTYLCMFAITSTAHLSLFAALSILVFGSLGMIVPVQGGIGAFHFMVAEGLVLYAIKKSDGLAYATIIHSSQTFIILIIGGASLILMLISSSKKAANEPDRLNK